MLDNSVYTKYSIIICIMLGWFNPSPPKTKKDHLLFITWLWPILTNQVLRYRAPRADEKRVIISLCIKPCVLDGQFQN